MKRSIISAKIILLVRNEESVKLRTILQFWVRV